MSSGGGVEFGYPTLRWLLKGWFFLSAGIFLYLFWIDVFVHGWFILVWSLFSLLLGLYVAPAIRIENEALGVKYLYRYRRIPWRRVLDVQKTLFGAQILTRDPHWAYRVVGYQHPMPGVGALIAEVQQGMNRGRSNRQGT